MTNLSYQCDPATLSAEKLGPGDIYLSAFARRPGLSATGAAGTSAPSFDPAAWAEATYLVRACVRMGEHVSPLSLAHKSHNHRRAGAASSSSSRPARTRRPPRARWRPRSPPG
jgi:hypothetical protein